MKEVEREIYPTLIKEFEHPEITVLIGARQVGKTFLLKKLFEYALSQDLTAKYLDLEQPEDLMLFNKGDRETVRLLTDNADAVFIDEFYYLKNASHIFKAIFDSGKKVKIFASGSSSTEIHKHMKESLAGRKRTFHIFPCSFREMKQVSGEEAFSEYLEFGGLPGLIAKSREDRLILLSDIMQSYILKDIKALVKEENVRAFNHLLYLLAENQGCTVSSAGLSREIGLTQKTIEHHLEIASQTRVIYPAFSFSRNMGNELKKSRKYYLYDLGIRNMMMKDYRNYTEREDGGFMLESFVLLELNRLLDPASEIRFWRTKDGKEVDFVFIRNRIPYPVEVKTTMRRGSLSSGLISFLKRYPETPHAFILNLADEGSEKFGKTVISFRKLEQTGDFLAWLKET